MKTYTNKSNANRAAKKAGMTIYTIETNTDGSFYIAEGYVQATGPVVAETPSAKALDKAVAKVAAAKPAKAKGGVSNAQAWKVAERGRREAVADKRSAAYV